MAQQLTQDEFVTYSRNSSFIKEFQVPVDDFGLRGIITDTQGSVWFYHSTSKSSAIFKFEPESNQFTKYEIEEKTQTTDAITSLSGGQLFYDKNENVIWFTDARTNSIGKLDIEYSVMELYAIPTLNAGPMGIILAPDNNTIWFTELSTDKLASFNIMTGKFAEYHLKENSGPTLLAFDGNGFLWVTMSYSNSILKINLDSLVSNSQSPITELKLPKGDVFSPFGIAFVSDNGSEKIVISDHGSSRIIVSDVSSNLNSYSSYWTSESIHYPQTLPAQIVTDESGNVYFAQHGGNKISKLDIKTETITEYDIPTGPLSTVIHIALDQNKKLWFAEVLANKIGYLDTTIPVPISVKTQESSIKIERNDTKHLDMQIEYGNTPSPLMDDLQISLAGMTHSGIDGFSYEIMPEKVSLSKDKTQATLSLSPQDNIKSGLYNIMLQVTAKEETDKELKVSILRPLQILVDIPETKILQGSEQTDKQDALSKITLKDVIQTVALSVAIGLSALIILRRIKLRASRNKPK